ncbi:MAG: trimeric intracellular cation channel family protein [Bacteroidetes bacterium]|nr:trimeric intracellular cation channel family protein [Bacteroidota bacterium]
MTQYLYPFDLAGTYFFAISGVLTAAQKKLDVFGALVIGFVTAIGGGSVRDIVMGATPLVWIRDVGYVLVILAGFVTVLLFRKYLQKLRKTLFLFDTIGIGLFSIMGLEKAILMGAPIPVAIFLGMTSAVMGGVIRDVICNEIPLIFRSELYATACLAGTLVFIGVGYLTSLHLVTSLAGMVTVIVLRILAIRYKWKLPLA